MKAFSILVLIINSAFAHQTNAPSHNIVSPHHGSPLLWVFMAITISFFMYKIFKNRK